MIWFTQIPSGLILRLILHILCCFEEVFGTFFIMLCFHLHFALVIYMYVEKYQQGSGYIPLIFLMCFGSSTSLPVWSCRRFVASDIAYNNWC